MPRKTRDLPAHPEPNPQARGLLMEEPDTEPEPIDPADDVEDAPDEPLEDET